MIKDWLKIRFFSLCMSPALALALNAVNAFAEVSNFSSVMVGDRASGMGGAFTSLTDDPAAIPFYNPAALARLNGTSLSTAVSLFNKYDVTYGGRPSLNDSIFRINRGTILSIPAASAIVSSFRNFAAGLSIVLPEYQNYGGTIHSQGNDSTHLRIDDQSLWVGGAFALNVTENDAVGFSTYYTSQSSSRSSTNQYAAGGGTTVENETLNLYTNAIIYQLGYYHEWGQSTKPAIDAEDAIAAAPAWRLGLSYRFRSILVDGSGNYSFSSVSTVAGASTPILEENLHAYSHVPERLSLGLSRSTSHGQTYSFDVSYYHGSSFSNLNKDGDTIDQVATLNYAFGYENHLEPWLTLRLGVFTDNSFAPPVPLNPARRYQDHIDKLGISANIGIQTTIHTRVSLGGYYLGGSGEAAEKIGPNYSVISKTERLFSFLVGSSYSF